MGIFLAVWTAGQLLLPLRHYLYPGHVSWTEEGHRFAWHMMLRSKSGTVDFRVRDAATGERLVVHPHRHLAGWQAEELVESPERMRQFAVYLEERMSRPRRGDVEVTVRTRVSLNGRPARALVDPAVDLTRVAPSLWRHADWILPLDEDP